MSNALPNRIVIGDLSSPIFEFDNASIANVGGIFAVDVVGNQLAVDTVTATVRYSRAPNGVYSPHSEALYVTRDGRIYILHRAMSLWRLPYGTPAWWYNNGSAVMAGYIQRVERSASGLYRLTIMSGVGLLDRQYHSGGVYTGERFDAVLADIIGGAFTYTVSEAVAGQEIYGWLPYDTRRANLHRLLFALGVSIVRGDSGTPEFVFLSGTVTANVPESRIAFGGRVDYRDTATGVEVVEHSYFPLSTDEETTLFDNTSSGMPADHTRIVFDAAPIHDLTATGTIEIHEGHVNYAVISGVGTLVGKCYTHTTRLVVKSADNAQGGENVKRVEYDQTLVSVANSQNVAKRVLAYYSSAKAVYARMVMSGERCGDCLSMLDPDYDRMTAFLQEADVNASTNLIGSATLIEGYTPTGQGNNVSGVETLTGAGTWTPPDGVDQITVVLIGGGTGGGAGNAGESPAEPALESLRYDDGNVNVQLLHTTPGAYTPAAGGEPGTPGAGGKVYVTQVSCTPGVPISFSCGAGGAGAIFGGADASDGGATVFGAESSESGARMETGYIDPISGRVLATGGASGIRGGAGGGILTDGENWSYFDEPVEYNGVTYYTGARGENNSYTNTSEGSENTGNGLFRINAYPGFGGGAAAGANGAAGGNASGTFRHLYGVLSGAWSYPGAGGAGANAVAPAKAIIPGAGGTGGNGGGGGGQWGYPAVARNRRGPQASQSTDPYMLRVIFNSPAPGGNGSDGGDGADGCVIIYY